MPRYLPYLLLLPATAFLALFFLYPFALVTIDSVTVGGEWGLGNFAKMASHWKFETAFWNTMLLAALVVPIQLAMALTMASIVTKLQRGRSAILYIFAIPLGISDLAAGLIWLAILEQTGFLNSVLHGIGVIEAPMLFLSYQNPWVILVAIALAEVWRATAIMMVILVAGMGLIPKEYGEAAEVFGASRWQRFHPRHAAPAAAQPADRADPAGDPGVRGLCRGRGAGRHADACPDVRNLQLAVQPAGPRHCGGLCHGDPGHLHRLHAADPARAARAEGGKDMTDTTVRRAGNRVFITGIALLIAWVLVPIYLLAVNALSAPDEITTFPRSWCRPSTWVRSASSSALTGCWMRCGIRSAWQP
jgi:ABC-type sulfate transport system permease component